MEYSCNKILVFSCEETALEVQMSLCLSVTKLKFTFHVCDITCDRNVTGTNITSEMNVQGMDITYSKISSSLYIQF